MCSLGFSSLAAAELPTVLTFDDGYTWYEVEDHQDSRDGSAFDAGWSLKAQLRVFGDADRESAFRLVLKQGRRTLGEMRCSGDKHLADGDGDVPYYSVQRRQCSGSDLRISQTGEITIEVYFVDGDTEQEHLARTHTIQVRTATRERRDRSNQPSRHYVDRSSEVANTLIRMVPRGQDGYLGGERFSHGFVEVVLNVTRGENLSRQRGQLRCTVDGESVRGDDRTAAGRVLSGRNVRVYREVRGERDYIGFTQMRVDLSISFGERAEESFLSLKQHPGAWVCEWKVDGNLQRTFRFQVVGGQIAAHPEEAGGLGLGLGLGAHLLDSAIPGETPIDARARPASTGFQGRAWSSDEARMSAAAVPSIGDAPFDAGGRRRGRRGRR